MVDVRIVDGQENPPDDADWILVERSPGGKFVASGSIRTSGVGASVPYFAPHVFLTEHAAISAAVTWATEHGYSAVYVRRSGT